MKSLLTLAIVLASTSAFATRARITALGNAAHLTDAATVYNKPADMFTVSDSLTIESGLTDVALVTGATANNPATGAEALLIRSHGDAKWALSLGHDDVRSFSQRSTSAVSAAARAQQNPIEVSYGMKSGDMAWAGTLVYSNYNDKAADEKESTMGLKFGAATSTWDATVDLGLTDKWEDAANNEFKGKSNVAVRGGFWVASDMYAYADVAMGGHEDTVAGTVASEIKTTDITVGAINTVKSEGNEFFWGAALASAQSKDSKGAEVKETSLMLPLIIGVEANAASWLTLRGSVTQNVLIQNEKTETATATVSEEAPGTNSTTFAAGAGLKLGKLALDGSLLAVTGSNPSGQEVNADDLLGTVGLTYAF
ncbi:hypothetical protein [Pseudobdellovibrio sp. HCB154]|uniref:hypothetical protein n=1 Tax=Pseudobdellovibrio sp. HCB154 TaxID=3386277 RepID=UPI0039171B0A